MQKRQSGFLRRDCSNNGKFCSSSRRFLTYDDLARFHSEWTQPVSSNYRGYDVWELPPNGQGIAALQILNILENYDLKKMGLLSSEYIHLFTEAKKIVFADRAKHADPNAKYSVNELISNLCKRTR